VPRAWRVAAQLADEVRTAKCDADAAAREAGAAIERNAVAQARLSELLKPYRALCAALVGGAGIERPLTLPDALSAAEAVLDGDGGDAGQEG
jgi:hypothetical protein